MQMLELLESLALLLLTHATEMFGTVWDKQIYTILHLLYHKRAMVMSDCERSQGHEEVPSPSSPSSTPIYTARGIFCILPPLVVQILLVPPLGKYS